MGHYDECREGYCGKCGQTEGNCEHTREKKANGLKVVIINGFPGSGKDTLIRLMCAINDGAPILNIHTSDPVKEAAKLLGWCENKTPETRDFLAMLKRESDRLFKASFRYVKSYIDNFKAIPGAILFVHCREQADVEFYVREYGAKTLLVQRNELDLSGITNSSDLRVLDISYDYIVPNNGTMKELTESAELLLKDLRA
jgi:hypothetical protein